MKKYKLLLVRPTQMVGSRIRKDYKSFLPNIALPTIAAYIPFEFDIEIIDESLEEIDFSKYYSIVAITALQNNVDRAIWVARRFKEIWKDKTLVVGGGISLSFIITEKYSLTESYQEKILKYFNHIFVGEADYSWRAFLNDFLKGVKREKIIQTKERPDLKNIPFPRIDLIKWNLYAKLPLFRTNSFKIGHLIPVETSRGCPYDCTFCCVTKFWGRQIRYRPAEDVVAHIKKLPKNTLIIFTDDNIASIPKYAEELFRIMIREKVKQKFFAQVTIQSAENSKLLELGSRAGWKSAYLGMESIQPNVLVSVNKTSNLPESIYDLIKKGELDKAKDSLKVYYSKIFSKFKTFGIQPFPSIIIGLSGDSVKNIHETIQFFIDESIPMMTQWFYTPFIGSQQFKDFDNNDILRHKTLGRHDAAHLVFNAEKVVGIANKELEKAFWSSYQNFYSIGNIFKRISKNKISFAEKTNLIIFNLFYYRAVMQRMQPCSLSWRTRWVHVPGTVEQK